MFEFRCFVFVGLFVMTSCNASEKKVEVIRQDSIQNFSLSSAAEAQRMIDSIIKAEGGKVSVSLSGSDSIKIDDKEAAKRNWAKLKVIDSKILDSLITSSVKKYTLIHFWATWCKPCRREFPDLLKSFVKLTNTDVLLVSSDYDSEEQKKKVQVVYDELKTEFPCFINRITVASDYNGSQSQKKLIANAGGKSDGGLPFNLLIENKTKKIVFSSGRYREIIDRLK